jgi:hypothetical protein
MTTAVENFDLERNIADAWTAFSRRLAEVVSMMDVGATLTLNTHDSELPGTEPFVRFRVEPGNVLVTEVPTNNELAADFRLTELKVHDLVELGWNSPDLAAAPPRKRYWRSVSQEFSELAADAAVAVLCEVFRVPHPVFLAPDQLAEILNPDSPDELPPSEFDAEDLVAIVPRSPEHLRELVSAELTKLLGHMPMLNDDGEFAIRMGTAMVFVRVTRDARELIVFSPAVHDVEGRTRASELLSDLNARSRYVKFIMLSDRVFITLSLMSHPFVRAHFCQALDLVGQLAAEMDEKLAVALRGEPYFKSDGE